MASITDVNYTEFMKKEAISSTIWHLLLVILFAVAGVAGCNTSEEPASSTKEGADLGAVVTDLTDRLTTASQEVAGVVAPHAQNLQDLGKEEVSKLFRWEYKVVEVPTSLAPTGLESELHTLGAANWECFSVTLIGDRFMITCKKRPVSAVQYLKHIPGL